MSFPYQHDPRRGCGTVRRNDHQVSPLSKYHNQSRDGTVSMLPYHENRNPQQFRNMQTKNWTPNNRPILRQFPLTKLPAVLTDFTKCPHWKIDCKKFPYCPYGGRNCSYKHPEKCPRGIKCDDRHCQFRHPDDLMGECKLCSKSEGSIFGEGLNSNLSTPKSQQSANFSIPTRNSDPIMDIDPTRYKLYPCRNFPNCRYGTKCSYLHICPNGPDCVEQPDCKHDHIRKPAASRTSAPSTKCEDFSKFVPFEVEIQQLAENFGKIPNPAKRHPGDSPSGAVIRRRTTNGMASPDHPCKDMPFCTQYFSCRYYHKICEQGVGCPYKKCPFTHCPTEDSSAVKEENEEKKEEDEEDEKKINSTVDRNDASLACDDSNEKVTPIANSNAFGCAGKNDDDSKDAKIVKEICEKILLTVENAEGIHFFN